MSTNAAIPPHTVKSVGEHRLSMQVQSFSDPRQARPLVAATAQLGIKVGTRLCLQLALCPLKRAVWSSQQSNGYTVQSRHKEVSRGLLDMGVCIICLMLVQAATLAASSA